MKNLRLSVLSLVVLMLCLGFQSVAVAKDLRFGWDYPPEEAAKIDGFRLYRDGQIVEMDNIPATATTITVPQQTDRKPHSYNLVAFVGTDNSGFSDSAIDVPVTVIRAVGPLTLEIIE